MAQKRMFDKRVVSSDKFIDLPHSSKALYFMAGMEADDKGFFQPRQLQRMCGFNDDDFKILIAKGYFITFESGVMVVTDWNKNNWLDSRRIAETEYVDELNLLKLINNKYELEEPKNNDAKQMLSENSIVENSIVYNILQNENNFEEEFNQLWKKYPNKQGRKDALRYYISARKKKVSYETVDKGIDNYIKHIQRVGIQKQYIMHGSTWFNGEHWNDEYNDNTNNGVIYEFVN